jgi:hypothetical protein
VVDQPVLGEGDRVARDGGAQTLELGDEVVVRRLVVDLVAVALRLELRLFRLEVADDGVVQVRQLALVAGVGGEVEDALEQTLVLLINVGVEDFERRVPGAQLNRFPRRSLDPRSAKTF